MVMARKSHNGRAFPFVCDLYFQCPRPESQYDSPDGVLRNFLRPKFEIERKNEQKNCNRCSR